MFETDAETIAHYADQANRARRVMAEHPYEWAPRRYWARQILRNAIFQMRMAGADDDYIAQFQS